ncbi:MAG: hypothetical protein Fur0041_21610 [Bacteroidia bacterium]
MLTRVVKMTFLPEHTDTFIRLFDEHKLLIVSFPGCQKLEMHRDLNNPLIFFTISRWNSPEDLEQYRKSELFAQVWKQTKALFAEKAEAWSMQHHFISK